MGSNNSNILGEDHLEDYVQLTYLNKSEILGIQKRFWTLGPDYFRTNTNSRFPFHLVIDVFPELKVNPFRDRLFKVFSSLHDNHLSFEDMLDLFSALSEDCPDKVKALWAFKMFDFNDDNCLNENDIMQIVDRLIISRTRGHANDDTVTLTRQEMQDVAQVVLDEMDMDKTGVITINEFVHAVMKMPDFASCFRLKL